jgi:hypothetical protein
MEMIGFMRRRSGIGLVMTLVGWGQGERQRRQAGLERYLPEAGSLAGHPMNWSNASIATVRAGYALATGMSP